MISNTLSLVLSFVSTAIAYCPPPGALLPSPVLSKSANFSIPDSVFSALQWQNDTSFAIKASIGDITVYQHEHSAPARKVPQSLYTTKSRFGSVTKAFTMLAVLLSKEKISLEDSITKFVPELNAEAWGEVTIAQLASHTSGLGRFGYVGDYAFRPAAAPELGLPVINNTLPGCDPAPGGRACTRTEILEMFNNAAYVPHSPGSGPLYSNIGYNLLGMALEGAHNKSAEEVINKLIVEPLGLTHTSFEVPPNDGGALFPRTEAEAKSWFVANFANHNPNGGLWSTPNDMLIFLQAILKNKLLTQAETRRWLQPRALLPSLHQLVGETWEIFRPTDIDLTFPRAINIFTKAGGVPGYAAYAILIPEHGIAITINTAGNAATNAIQDLFPLVVESLVSFADQLSQSQAAAKYTGTYRRVGSNDTVALVMDDGPGVAIAALTINNVNVLQAFANQAKVPLDNFSARLYPTDPDSLGSDKENWRMLLDTKARQNGFADQLCASWNWGDFGRYVREPLDTVSFDFDGDTATSVEFWGWRAKLDKVT